MIAIAGLLFWYLPSSFVPPEDQGYLIGNVQLPDGATLERTGQVSAQFQRMMPDFPEFEYVNVINGNDIIGGGTKSSAANAVHHPQALERARPTRSGHRQAT